MFLVLHRSQLIVKSPRNQPLARSFVNDRLRSLMTLNLIDEITKTKGNPKRECLGQGPLDRR